VKLIPKVVNLVELGVELILGQNLYFDRQRPVNLIKLKSDKWVSKLGMLGYVSFELTGANKDCYTLKYPRIYVEIIDSREWKNKEEINILIPTTTYSPT
jgi:hypothetical protein